MMRPATPDPTIALAAHIASALKTMGVECALIGGGALAVHGYPRATMDVDLAVAVDPMATLIPLSRALTNEGLQAVYAAPDAGDALGGVLTVTGAETDPVQVVNFVNMLRSRNQNPGPSAIRTARPMRDFPALRVVDLAHLIALKLRAGGTRSLQDVSALLDANPEASRAEIGEVCASLGVGDAWRSLA